MAAHLDAAMQGTAEAKNNLSAVTERALAGENIIITRHGTLSFP